MKDLVCKGSTVAIASGDIGEEYYLLKVMSDGSEQLKNESTDEWGNTMVAHQCQSILCCILTFFLFFFNNFFLVLYLLPFYIYIFYFFFYFFMFISFFIIVLFYSINKKKTTMPQECHSP